MSSYVDATSGAVEHCETMARSHADLSEKYEEISNLCKQKLWHQLTLSVLPFVSDVKNLRTTSDGTNSFLALYDKVVLCVDKKLNPISLCQIASAVANSLVSSDTTAAKQVLENLLEQKARIGVPATLYVESRLNLIQLEVELDKSQLQSIQDSIKSNAQKLQDLSVENSLVHSAHYECSMKYRKAVGPPEIFFHEAFQYLNHTPMEQMKDPKALAVDISLAALTGKGVFHFGQVVTAPILSCLEETEESWLMEFMHCMANGDVTLFEELSKKYAAQIQAQPALVHRADAVKEKITLLAFVNMVFQRPSSERTLGFEEIAQEIHVPQDQVEWVIMRALSLELVHGQMDQIDETVQITWVMPRVLTSDQLKEMAARFGEWAVKVSKTRDYVAEKTPALFA